MKRGNIRLIGIAICVSLISCLSSCSTKQDPINDLAILVEDVQANGAFYSEDDWGYVTQQIDVIENEIEQYKNEYTDEECKEIGRLKGILLAQYAKNSVRSFKNGVENAINEAEGIVDGFLNSFSSESSQ